MKNWEPFVSLPAHRRTTVDMLHMLYGRSLRSRDSFNPMNAPLRMLTYTAAHLPELAMLRMPLPECVSRESTSSLNVLP